MKMNWMIHSSLQEIKALIAWIGEEIFEWLLLEKKIKIHLFTKIKKKQQIFKWRYIPPKSFHLVCDWKI